MTAIPARRRKATLISFVAAVLGIAAVIGLGYAGIDNLYDSRSGRRVSADEPDVPVQQLPDTPTALVATADEEGWLTSVAVLALNPGGTGGSIVSLSPSGDAASGNIDSLAPLNAVYVVDGPDELLGATEGLTGISFDVAEVVDAARFAALTTPIGEMTVELPTELRDTSTGERYDAGVVSMTPDQAAAAGLVAGVGGAFEHERTGTGTGRGVRGGQPGRAAPDHHDIPLAHDSPFSSIMGFGTWLDLRSRAKPHDRAEKVGGGSAATGDIEDRPGNEGGGG